jgi:pimeloyl-ACP methyl ester carboxylesterase
VCRNWELSSPWTNAPVHVKALFIAGKKDMVLQFPGMKKFVMGPRFRQMVPNLQNIIFLEGSHFIHEEKPEKFNNELISFLTGLKSKL